MGTIRKTIYKEVCCLDSMKGILPSGLREKVEQYAGRVTTSNNFGYAIDQIGRNMGNGHNNNILGGQVNQAAEQLLHDLTSNRNT
jgi:hypothetical protein